MVEREEVMGNWEAEWSGTAGGAGAAGVVVIFELLLVGMPSGC
jgi:hypothetical protein